MEAGLSKVEMACLGLAAIALAVQIPILTAEAVFGLVGGGGELGTLYDPSGFIVAASAAAFLLCCTIWFDRKLTRVGGLIVWLLGAIPMLFLLGMVSGIGLSWIVVHDLERFVHAFLSLAAVLPSFFVAVSLALNLKGIYVLKGAA